MRNPFAIIAELDLPAPRGIIQVGANSGQEVDLFVRHGVKDALLIEPLPGPFGALSARCAKHPGFVPANMLCGSIDGEEVEFHVASNNGQSSSMLKPERHLADYPWVRFSEPVRMTTFTLDRIVASLEATRPSPERVLDMLYLDVQGAELHVLKGGNAALQKARYVFTEVGLGGAYGGDVRLMDLMQFLGVYGYDLHELEIGKTGFGEAMFVRGKGGRLRQAG